MRGQRQAAINLRTGPGGVCITLFLMLVHRPLDRAPGACRTEDETCPMSETQAAATPWPAMSIAEANRIITAPGMPCEMEELVIRGVPTRVWKNAAADPALGRRGGAQRTARRSSWSTRTSGSATRRSSARSRRWRTSWPRRASRRATGSPSSCATCRNGRSPSTRAAALGAIVTPLNAWWTGPELEYGLVDSADQGRLRRRRAAGAHQRAPGATAPTCSASTSPRERRDRQSADRQAGGRDRRAGRAGRTCRTGRCPPWRSRPRTTRPSSTPPAPRASRRARSPPSATSTPTSWPPASAGQRSFLRRGETPPAPDPERAAALDAAVGAVLPRHRLLRGAEPARVRAAASSCMMRRWDPVRAFELIEREKIQAAGGVPTIAWQLIEHPAAQELRPLVAGERRLWRRALGAGAGAQDQGDLPEVAGRQRLGHDRDLRHRHLQRRGGLRAPARQLRPAGAGHRPEDHDRRGRPRARRSARSASCGARARRS